MLLLAFGVAWTVAGVAAATLGLAAASWLVDRLPPLAIDAQAVGGAATAVGVGLLIIGLAHLSVVVGLGGGRRWAPAAGLLLCGTLTAMLVASAAAAVTSAVRAPENGLLLLAVGAGLLASAAVYGWCAARLVGRIGAGSAT
jgi:hypothetical protein